MPRKKKVLPFNKQTMDIRSCMDAATALESILRDYDNFQSDPDELLLRVAQVRDGWTFGSV